jgi:hypothetical protein
MRHCIDFDRIESVVKTFSPKVITVVHCENSFRNTKSDSWNWDRSRKSITFPVMIVDAVSSIACTPVKGWWWNAIMSWEILRKVCPFLDYWVCVHQWFGMGCHPKDSLWRLRSFLPWYRLERIKCHPNTPDWIMELLQWMCSGWIGRRGYEEVFSRHIQVAEYIRKTVCDLLSTFSKRRRCQSPSVSAVYIPDGYRFLSFNQKIRIIWNGDRRKFWPIGR